MRLSFWRLSRQHQRELFRMGYYAALDDIERTGTRPVTVGAQKAAADRHLRRMEGVDGSQ